MLYIVLYIVTHKQWHSNRVLFYCWLLHGRLDGESSRVIAAKRKATKGDTAITQAKELPVRAT